MNVDGGRISERQQRGCVVAALTSTSRNGGGTAMATTKDTTTSGAVIIYGLCDSRISDRVARVRYVGRTTTTTDRRLAQHLAAARLGGQTHRDRWIRAVLKSCGCVTIVELARVPVLFVDAAEIDWIAKYRSLGCRLTNHTDGGGGPLNPDKEARSKMSLAAIERMKAPGVRERLSEMATAQWSTPEARARLSDAAAARWTPNERARQSVAMLAACATDETRARMSAASKRRASDPVERERLLQMTLGRAHSREEREKRAAALRRYISEHPEHRRKMSARQKAAWADPVARAIRVESIRRASQNQELRAHRSEVAKRIFRTPEARERSRQLGMAQKGRHASSEIRQKLSAALLGKGGELGRRAILKWAQVREIRARALAGEAPAQLARAYGVSRGTVSALLRGKTWVEA